MPFILLIVGLEQICGASDLLPLSDSEADAIIEARETAKADRKAARIAELAEAKVKSEGRGVLPNGQEVIIREVVPPAHAGTALVSSPDRIEGAAAPNDLSAPLVQFTPEQIAKMQQQTTQHRVLMFSTTVYDRSVTRVRWTHAGEKYLAYTNADFNFLRGVTSVTTQTDSYDFLMGIGDVSTTPEAGTSFASNPEFAKIAGARRNSEDTLPRLPIFSEVRSEYVLMEGDPNNFDATAGLEILLAYYDANLETLKIEFQRNEALTVAQKRFNATNPKEPEPFIMQFWVPEPHTEVGKSTANQPDHSALPATPAH